jgi:hypothetical protein
MAVLDIDREVSVAAATATEKRSICLRLTVNSFFAPSTLEDRPSQRHNRE